MYSYWKLLAHLFVDRRAYRGSSEFGFRPRPGTRELLRMDIVSRESEFRAAVFMRRGTSDVATFAQIFGGNDYNLRRLARGNEIRSLYEGMLKKSTTPLILDFGANIGLASLYFSKNWTHAHIIAVEPQHDSYLLMCRNLAGHENVQLVEAAVAAEDGAVTIVNPEAEPWAFRTERAAAESASNTIPAMSVQSIRSLAPSGRVYRPFIVKIDIEGFESDLFSKNLDWIDSFPIIIIELHDKMLPKKATSNPFLRAIAPLDRDFVLIGENVLSIANDRP